MHRFLTVAMAVLIALPAWAQTPAPRTGPAPRTPAPRVDTAPPPAAARVGKVDINTATEQQLDTLPGVGPVRARAIVAARPYADLQDLVTKKVLTQGVLDKAKAGMALANVNTSSAADMEKTLPGIGAVRSKAIVAGRPYASLQDLVTKNVLTQAALDKIRELAAF